MSRIVAAAAFVVLVAAGCGGGARPQNLAAGGVPDGLARVWAGQASAIAAAAAAGNDCQAQTLAKSLRGHVLQKRQLLPLRLRSPLVTGVDSLVARTTCTPPPTVATTPQPHGPKPPHKPPSHKPHGDGHGHHGHHGHDGRDG